MRHQKFQIQELAPANRSSWARVDSERIADIEVDRQVRWGANYKHTFWPELLRLARKGLEAEQMELGRKAFGAREGAQKTNCSHV